jgi:hypothetical protein
MRHDAVTDRLELLPPVEPLDIRDPSGRQTHQPLSERGVQPASTARTDPRRFRRRTADKCFVPLDGWKVVAPRPVIRDQVTQLIIERRPVTAGFAPVRVLRTTVAAELRGRSLKEQRDFVQRPWVLTVKVRRPRLPVTCGRCRRNVDDHAWQRVVPAPAVALVRSAVRPVTRPRSREQLQLAGRVQTIGPGGERRRYRKLVGTSTRGRTRPRPGLRRRRRYRAT